MANRKCFVPTCRNNTRKCPDKIFVRIREDLREKWCREAKATYFKAYTQYCCEDHIDPQQDLANYFKYKLMNDEPKLKRNAVLRYKMPKKKKVNLSRTPRLDSDSDLREDSELRKLLLQPTVRQPIKQEPEHTDNADTPNLSMSSFTNEQFQVDVGIQCQIEMTDKSTNTE